MHEASNCVYSENVSTNPSALPDCEMLHWSSVYELDVHCSETSIAKRLGATVSEGTWTCHGDAPMAIARWGRDGAAAELAEKRVAWERKVEPMLRLSIKTPHGRGNCALCGQPCDFTERCWALKGHWVRSGEAETLYSCRHTNKCVGEAAGFGVRDLSDDKDFVIMFGERRFLVSRAFPNV